MRKVSGNCREGLLWLQECFARGAHRRCNAIKDVSSDFSRLSEGPKGSVCCANLAGKLGLSNAIGFDVGTVPALGTNASACQFAIRLARLFSTSALYQSVTL